MYAHAVSLACAGKTKQNQSNDSSILTDKLFCASLSNLQFQTLDSALKVEPLLATHSTDIKTNNQAHAKLPIVIIINGSKFALEPQAKFADDDANSVDNADDNDDHNDNDNDENAANKTKPHKLKRNRRAPLAASLARKLNCVVFAFEYRNDVLGFLPVFGGGLLRANHALYDIVGLLHFVRRFGAEFGGDSADVTLLASAQSGALLHAQLVALSPLSAGLFSRLALVSTAAQVGVSSAPAQLGHFLVLSGNALRRKLSQTPAKAHEFAASLQLMLESQLTQAELSSLRRLATSELDAMPSNASSSLFVFRALKVAKLSTIKRLQTALQAAATSVAQLACSPLLDDSTLFSDAQQDSVRKLAAPISSPAASRQLLFEALFEFNVHKFKLALAEYLRQVQKPTTQTDTDKQRVDALNLFAASNSSMLNINAVEFELSRQTIVEFYILSNLHNLLQLLLRAAAATSGSKTDQFSGSNLSSRETMRSTADYSLLRSASLESFVGTSSEALRKFNLLVWLNSEDFSASASLEPEAPLEQNKFPNLFSLMHKQAFRNSNAAAFDLLRFAEQHKVANSQFAAQNADAGSRSTYANLGPANGLTTHAPFVDALQSFIQAKRHNKQKPLNSDSSVVDIDTSQLLVAELNLVPFLQFLQELAVHSNAHFAEAAGDGSNAADQSSLPVLMSFVEKCVEELNESAGFASTQLNLSCLVESVDKLRHKLQISLARDLRLPTDSTTAQQQLQQQPFLAANKRQAALVEHSNVSSSLLSAAGKQLPSSSVQRHSTVKTGILRRALSEASMVVGFGLLILGANPVVIAFVLLRAIGHRRKQQQLQQPFERRRHTEADERHQTTSAVRSSLARKKFVDKVYNCSQESAQLRAEPAKAQQEQQQEQQQQLLHLQMSREHRQSCNPKKKLKFNLSCCDERLPVGAQLTCEPQAFADLCQLNSFSTTPSDTDAGEHELGKQLLFISPQSFHELLASSSGECSSPLPNDYLGPHCTSLNSSCATQATTATTTPTTTAAANCDNNNFINELLHCQSFVPATSSTHNYQSSTSNIWALPLPDTGNSFHTQQFDKRQTSVGPADEQQFADRLQQVNRRIAASKHFRTTHN